ncbi:MAG: hypothetical protein WC087_00885 [Candidatus Paceibacterota bacterium]
MIQYVVRRFRASHHFLFTIDIVNILIYKVTKLERSNDLTLVLLKKTKPRNQERNEKMVDEITTPTGSVEGTVATPPNAWDERIKSFSDAVGKSPEEVGNALKGLVGEPGPAALDVLSDSTSVEDGDLKVALVDGGPMIPLGVFRKNLPKLRGPQRIVVADTPTGMTFDVLPTVPDDASFLEMLKVGGVLRPEKAEVISAIKAALASKCGLFDLPKNIIERMEKFAEDQDEPVGLSFYELRKIVVSRSYAEVLSVLGIEGSFVSEPRKNAFLRKVDENLWNEIESFYQRLFSWNESWAGSANPAMAMSMYFQSQATGNKVLMPPGMMAPPETSGVRDAAESVIDQINKVFSGVGVPIARALAYDATRVKGILENPSLPASIGATSREQMLKMLGADVNSDYVRLERNLTRFTLAIMELPNLPSGSEEISYLMAMYQLGAMIPWDKLSNDAGRAGIGRKRL